jgi:TolB-like protein/DNA-binding winged helix-turn-helix (wHTH) protein
VPVKSYKFGDFEVHPARFELSRAGQKVKIERIPLDLLILLLTKDGEVASREEIVERLWGKDVFLDTEHGINTAVRKVRAALQDDRDAPRFIQTISGKGYRFVSDVLDKSMEQAARPPVELFPSEEPATKTTQSDRVSHLRRWVVVALLAILCLTAVLIFSFRDAVFGRREIGPIHSIAVLPLTNLSGDANQDYFADGLTDEVITMLAKETTLRVVSRTSTMRFKKENRSLHDIAHDLGVDSVLEGSVSRVNGRVHVTVQLIYAPSDTHVWADSYDRDMDHAFELPMEISRAIGRKLSPGTPVTNQKNVNPEAYDAYLQARYHWFRSNFTRSQEFYEKAIQIQPDYAPAWAGLSSCFSAAGVEEVYPSKEIAERAEATARKAIELDDTLAEGHHAMAAYYLFYAWDLPRADAESRRAIELNPNIAEQHHLHSYTLFAMNRIDEALAEQKRAMDIDPFERVWGMGRAYIQAREFDRAILELRLRAEALPTDPGLHWLLSRAYWQKNMSKESQQELEEMLRLENPARAESARKAYAEGGEQAVARWIVNDAIKNASSGYAAPFRIAQQYGYLGDKDKTLKYLEAAYRDRDPKLILVQTEPEFDFLHKEPRYQAIVRGVGLEFLTDAVH